MRWVGLGSCLVAIACGRVGFDLADDRASDANAMPDVVDGAGPPANVMFVTSTLHVPGTLGSLAAADAICAQRAFEANLAGTFVAWLSTSSVEAITRLYGARGWVRPDGRPFIDRPEDIPAGRLFNPPRIDELGNVLGIDDHVITGTAQSGGSHVNRCNEYTDTGVTGHSGLPWRSHPAWTNSFSYGCDQPARLYCFQIDRTVPLAPTPQPGRLAFVTTGQFTPASGRADADTLCSEEAQAQGVPGSFKALLAATGETAISRFDVQGPTWVRSDGMPLALTASEFAKAQLLTTPDVTLSGDHVNVTVIAGLVPDVVADDADTCANWSSAASTVRLGLATSSSPSAFSSSDDTLSCGGSAPVYCLQE